MVPKMPEWFRKIAQWFLRLRNEVDGDWEQVKLSWSAPQILGYSNTWNISKCLRFVWTTVIDCKKRNIRLPIAWKNLWKRCLGHFGGLVLEHGQRPGGEVDDVSHYSPRVIIREAASRESACGGMFDLFTSVPLAITREKVSEIATWLQLILKFS